MKTPATLRAIKNSQMGGRELSSIRQISNFTQANTLPNESQVKSTKAF
jgi:hypothetical protein